jgi:hypothetical protein
MMIIGNRRQRLADRMPGTELFSLLVPEQLGVGKGGLDRIAAMPLDNVQAGGADRTRALEDMRQHRPASQRLQNFRQAGMHAFALACRQDDDR